MQSAGKFIGAGDEVEVSGSITEVKNAEVVTFVKNSVMIW
jgi:hypothetical protein